MLKICRIPWMKHGGRLALTHRSLINGDKCHTFPPIVKLTLSLGKVLLVLAPKVDLVRFFFSPWPSDKSWRQKETSPVSHSEVLRWEWQPCWGTLNARSIQIQMMVRKEWRRGGVPGVTRHCSKWILPHPMIILLPSVFHPMKSSVWLLGHVVVNSLHLSLATHASPEADYMCLCGFEHPQCWWAPPSPIWNLTLEKDVFHKKNNNKNPGQRCVLLMGKWCAEDADKTKQWCHRVHFRGIPSAKT